MQMQTYHNEQLIEQKIKINQITKLSYSRDTKLLGLLMKLYNTIHANSNPKCKTLGDVKPQKSNHKLIELQNYFHPGKSQQISIEKQRTPCSTS